MGTKLYTCVELYVESSRNKVEEYSDCNQSRDRRLMDIIMTADIIMTVIRKRRNNIQLSVCEVVKL